MNYFEFFELPVSPNIDEEALKRRFIVNSKKYHPDFYTLSGPDEQDEALERSTLNNQAFRVLSDPDQRLRYLLELRGALAEEGQNQVPQDFLMEMMEINEALMELEFEDDPNIRQKVEGLVDQLEMDLHGTIQPVLDRYEDKTAGEAELSALRDYYLKRRYLLRIRENLSNFAPK